MVGVKNSKEKLNTTLAFIAELLNQNDIYNWFVAYGTLLGIVRGNSCIANDDDVDFVCNVVDYEKIKEMLQKSRLEFDY
jgi:phosphorylcholine metabolism protein LicD